MRHRNLTAKLGRKDAHRDAVVANIVTSLLKSGRVVTTLRIAHLARRYADRMVTLAKTNTLHSRRQAISFLRPSGESAKEVVRSLFSEIGPKYVSRPGGYTRVLKLAPRRGDAAPMAVMELVGAEMKPKVRKERADAADIQVETEIAPGATVAEAKREEEKPAASPHHAEKTEHPHKGHKEHKEHKEHKDPHAPGEKQARPEQPKDRKGGIMRFIDRLWHPDGGKK